MACINGLSIFVRQVDSGIFPEENYTLHWQLGILSGNVSQDSSTWHWKELKNPSIIVFYLDNSDFSGNRALSNQKGPIELELYMNGTKAAEPQSFKPDWVTSMCNYCTGPCEDLVKNAKIEMTVSLQSSPAG
jgi:hypothetical protein